MKNSTLINSANRNYSLEYRFKGIRITTGIVAVLLSIMPLSSVLAQSKAGLSSLVFEVTAIPEKWPEAQSYQESGIVEKPDIREQHAESEVSAAGTSLEFALPGAAAKKNEPARSPVTRNEQGSYEAAISRLIESDGPFAAGLDEPLLGLGRYLQEQGEHEQAIEVLARAEHIIRVNHGLNSELQFVPVKLAIDSYQAMGDFQKVLERQEYLLYLHQSLYGHDAKEVVPVLAALGSMYLAAYQRGIDQDGQEKELVLRYGQQTNFQNPDLLNFTDIAFLWLGQAQQHFYRGIQTLIKNEQYFDPVLTGLEKQLINTLFLQANRRKIEVDGDFFMSAQDTQIRDTLRMDEKNRTRPMYKNGVVAFARILTYLQNNPAALPEDVADAMLQLGDWHLLFGYRKQGEQQYAKAIDYLTQSGCDPQIIQHLANPEVPVQLPVFLSQPHSRQKQELAANENLEFSGYIDLAFRVDESGKAVDLEILGKSANADRPVQDRLIKIVSNAPYRPALKPVQGRDQNRVALRYQFAWTPGYANEGRRILAQNSSASNQALP